MRIIVCGMPRSMTTWLYNVLHELTCDLSFKSIWISADDLVSENEYLDYDGNVLGKCHHYSEKIAKSSNLIIYSFRDIRYAAISVANKWPHSDIDSEVKAWVGAGEAWRLVANKVYRFEHVLNSQLNCLQELRCLLSEHIDVNLLSSKADIDIIKSIDMRFLARQEVKGDIWDEKTMILPGHKTFVPAFENLYADQAELFSRIGRDFSWWLSAYGYFHGESYGQELDFKLAYHAMRLMPSPRVIDVGVERGSFIDLALNAGAGEILGFEVLPRHLDFLREKFKGQPLIKIIPSAVSSHSGYAKFHIAVNADGVELDYHHTLSDLGDSQTVFRNKTIDVQTVSLWDLAANGSIPMEIDFLKVDTDGHDLEVLRGLGELAPRMIFAEYWDTLPRSSGISVYMLSDLVEWGRDHGYCGHIVVRRHDSLEFLEAGTSLTEPGDWGNVLLIRDQADYDSIKSEVEILSSETRAKNYSHFTSLATQLTAKEAVIRGLAENHQANQSNGDLMLSRFQYELEQKDQVILELRRSLIAYRAALISFRGLSYLLTPIFRFFRFKIFYRTYIKPSLVPKLGKLNQHQPRPLIYYSAHITKQTLNDSPSISIVTPSYNQSPFISKTIDSILQQNYKNLEYFIQDGLSNDGTQEVLRSFESQLSGWESVEDGGQSQAINLGFTKTQGEIMGWLNSDDILLPNALNVIAEYFSLNPDVDVVYGNRILIDIKDQKIGRWILPGHDDDTLSWADFVPQETLFWRRRIWDKIGGKIDESYRFAMDWDLLIRFREAGARFAHIPEFIGAFRVHSHQKTLMLIDEVGRIEMDRIRMRTLGFIPSDSQIRNAVSPYLAKHLAFELAYKIKKRIGVLK